ncbi:MAG: tetratricopeptide repeat protein [Alphaproteobacteria bacterium]|nr:tetratricopeptide repeat protein [Alphaproteobacteria bacterium]
MNRKQRRAVNTSSVRSSSPVPPPPETPPEPEILPPEQLASRMFDEAVSHHQAGRAPESEALYRAILAIAPGHAEACYNLGLLCHMQGRKQEAMVAYRLAIARRGDYVDAYSNLGTILQDLGQFDEAIAIYRQAIAIKPDFAMGYGNLGVALKEAGKFNEAVDAYQHAIAIKPDYDWAYANLSAVWHGMGEWEKAILAARQALAINPASAMASFNLATTYQTVNQLDAAAAAFRQTLAIVPDLPEAHYRLGQILLQQGNYNAGWPENDWRWRLKGGTWLRDIHGEFAQPRWSGESLEGKTILLYAEQDLSDAIQFVRYVPLVVRSADHVILAVRPPLVELFKGIQGVAVVSLEATPLPVFDVHCPLLSLPHIFGTRLDTIPSGVPYLVAEPQRIAKWREKLPSDGFRIGIGWQDFADDAKEAGPSFPLRGFGPLTRLPGVRLVSLQGDPGLDMLSPLKKNLRLIDLGTELEAAHISSAANDAFLDRAALMMSLDLVITSDTDTAHLAGALGVPVWIVLKHTASWRWLLDREDSPWYPIAHLFRQRASGDWGDVVKRVLEQLRTRESGLGSDADFDAANADNDRLWSSSSPVPYYPEWNTDTYGIPWPLTEMHGWGLVGVHTILYLLEVGRAPLLFNEPVLDSMRPHVREKVEPLAAACKRFAALRDHKDKASIFKDLIMLHGVGNGMLGGSDIRSRRNIGVIAFEDTRFDAAAREVAYGYDHMIAHSLYNQRLLQEIGVRDVRMVWQGVDPSELVLPKRANRFGDRFVVFSGGKLEFRKAQDVVLEGFRRFHARCPDSVLIAAWYNLWPQSGLTMAESRISKVVPTIDPATGGLAITQWATANGVPADAFVDLGFLSRSQMTMTLAEVDAAVFPNRCEGATNLVAMEVMGCGIPCVVAANSGQLDLMIEEDVCFPLRSQTPLDNPNGARTGWCDSDPDEIAEALEKLYTDRAEAKRRGQRGQDFILGQRTWRKFAEQFVAECDR